MASETVSQLAETRKTAHEHHVAAARRLRFGMLGVNVLFAMAFVGGAVLWAKTHSGLLLLATVAVARWLTRKVRARRSEHLRLARGFAQPFAEELLGDLSHPQIAFALYLRGFELEQSEITYRGDSPETGSDEASLDARPLEALLRRMLREDLPLIALSNPSVEGPLEGAHRFANLPSDWEERVWQLVASARLIVLRFAALSAGLLRELHLLESAGAADRTIVIVSRTLPVKSQSYASVRSTVARFPHVIVEQSGPSWSRHEERAFHARLRIQLQSIEQQSVKDMLLQHDITEYELSTPSALERVRRFGAGPALWGTILISSVLVFQIYAVLSQAMSTEVFWREAREMFLLWWPSLILALVVLKAFNLLQHRAFLRGYHGKAKPSG